MKMNLVGAGYWGSKLLRNLAKFDVDATVFDIRNGQSINDINNKDPVILATPLWQHYEQTMQLLERGHDVYVEKPMAETTLQLLDINEKIKKDQLLMVGHIFVYHPQMQLIKDIIANGGIGTIHHVRSERSNWGIYQTKTDPLLSLATHDISIVQNLISNMIVTNQQVWNYSNNVVPDRVWFCGPSYDIDITWYSPVRLRRTTILGTIGQLVWDQDANTVTHYRNRIENNRAIEVTPTVYTYDYKLTPLESELKHWIDCVRTRTQPSTGIEQALAVAGVIDRVKAITQPVPVKSYLQLH